MKSDKQLIEEIDEKIREIDYPGSSLNCGVQPIEVNEKFVCFYYPKENCVMKVFSPEKKKIIRGAYTRELALKLIKK